MKHYTPSEENERLAKIYSLNGEERKIYEILNKSPSGMEDLKISLNRSRKKVSSLLSKLRERGILYEEVLEHPKKVYFVRPEQRIDVFKDKELIVCNKTRERVSKIFESLEKENFFTNDISLEFKRVGIGASSRNVLKLLQGLEAKGLVRHYDYRHRIWYLPPQLKENERVEREIIDHIQKFMTINGLNEYNFSLTDLLNTTTISDKEAAEKVLSEFREAGLTALEGEKYLFKETSYPNLIGLQESMDAPFNFLEEFIVPLKPDVVPEYVLELKDQILKIAQEPVRSTEIGAIGISRWKLFRTISYMIEEGTLKRMAGEGSCYYVPSEENERLAKIKISGNYSRKVYKFLEKKPLTISEIAEKMKMTNSNVGNITRLLIRKGLIYQGIKKNTGRGCENYLYVKPKHRREALIKSIGRDAFKITEMIKNEGAKPTQELAKRLGKRHSADLIAVLRNLVKHSILKLKKSRIGNVYCNVYHMNKDGPGLATAKSKQEPRIKRRVKPIEKPIPTQVKMEKWIELGSDGKRWIDHHLGYGPGFRSRNLLETLQEHGPMKVENLSDYWVLVEGDFLEELNKRKAIRVYEKEKNKA